jgi:ubiquinone/menaquinone biosynthesis C-methylase UbiE
MADTRKAPAMRQADGLSLNEHKRRVAAPYNLAAAGYDKPNVRFFHLVAQQLVDLVGLQPGQRVLDVATGTGATALCAARALALYGGEL